MEIFMSVVKIDYLGTCEELELSTGLIRVVAAILSMDFFQWRR